MVEVNTDELNNKVESLNVLIDEYEEIKINLFNQLKDACVNWQDGNSNAFDDSIQLEKNETELILQFLKNMKDVLEYSYDKYSELGKKIKCNLDNKASIKYAIVDCKNQVTDILNEFNKIDSSFYYSERYSINLQKSEMKTCYNNLEEIEKKIDKLYSRIEEIEKEIKDKIQKIEEVKINDFDYVLG